MLITIGSKQIGLTIEQTAIRFTTLRKKKAWDLDRTGFLPLPDGAIVDDQFVKLEEIRGIFKKWIQQEKLTGATVSLAVPTSQIIVRKMRIPTTNDKELRALIELEVETTLHLPFEEPIYDFLQIGKDETSTQVLIFAAPLKWIRTAMELMEDSGLRVKAITFPAAALAKSLFAQQTEKTSETMVLNIGDSMLEIFMFHEGSPIFMRAINLLESGDHQPGHLNESQLSELSTEISRILNFYQFGLHEGASRISKAIVAGSVSAQQVLISILRETQAEIAIHEADFPSFEDGSLDDEQANYLIPAGLALPKDLSFNIDLLPRVNREAKLLPVVITSALGAWLLIMTLIGYSFMTNRTEISDNKDQVQTLNDQIALAQNELLTGAAHGQSNPLSEIEAIKKKQKDVVAIVNELEHKLPLSAEIRTLGYTEQGQISLTASFNSMKDMSRYLFDLHRLSFAEDAGLQTMSKGETMATSTDSGGISVSNPYTASFSVKMKRSKEDENNGTTN
ncbi:type IV pilus biogenesis protein PilM [Paenibacillus lignilyticus]|uniref:Pilus assembly protein PilM n=1 Tax=Paenibacillus lignilyticus TaxID=1172615 RepID=A0ABS5CLV5_9BACL|nr:pilus assembly protein PilM [Paenibacillus lignilyticus]MBP3966849.1 pilus assembly protein PilM [Paenibacillus lignilyticus]